MARILEALQQQREGGRRAPAVASTPAPHPANPQGTPTAAAAEEVPFIEVGGPRLEAHPTVLAHKGPKPRPAILPLEDRGHHAPRDDARHTERDANSGRDEVRHAGHHSAPTAGTAQVTESRAPTPSSIAFQPVAAAIGAARPRFAPELIAFHQPDHALSQQYRGVLDHLVATARSGDARVLLLSGVTAGAGATTVLLNLAITHARDSKQRVLVADTDTQRSTLADKLGMNPVPGLREVLTAMVPLQRAIRGTGEPNLAALTLGEDSERSALAVRSLKTTFQQLRKRFDLILVDGPTWQDGPEMLSLAAACDALFLVLPHSEAGTPETTDLFQTILRQGIHLRGCLLTQSA